MQQLPRVSAPSLTPLTAISPVDGRYWGRLSRLSEFTSEFSLIRYRLLVEVEYFIALCELPLPQLSQVDKAVFPKLRNLYVEFTETHAQAVKDIEKTTNHDVKAVEYYLKNNMDELGLSAVKEFVHFGLTSQDINNTAMPLALKRLTKEVVLPSVQEVLHKLTEMSDAWDEEPMLARTHGQPATPTRLGKELRVFTERLQRQLAHIQTVPFVAKFGGATGQFNAHHVAYPDIAWPAFADSFLKGLGLERLQFTTQIEHYDEMAALFDGLARVNTILVDLCRDMWQYISMEYFTQRVVAGEIGSSAMPHKVNPIDFENAEGNLGLANALFHHLSSKLPISRLQRDLTDSTVTRNIGVPMSHTVLALDSLAKGLSKVVLNKPKLESDLRAHYVVISEAIQTVLRREGFPEPYEAVKALTRGHSVDEAAMAEFVASLKVGAEVKEELLRITPFSFVGVLPREAGRKRKAP